MANAVVNVNLNRSVMLNVLAIEACCMLYPGPSRKLTPELPYLPAGGTAKQAVPA